MHSGPYFGSVVAYLRGLLDDEAMRLSATSDGDAALERVATAFRESSPVRARLFRASVRRRLRQLMTKEWGVSYRS